jgi:hypothetical protein
MSYKILGMTIFIQALVLGLTIAELSVAQTSIGAKPKTGLGTLSPAKVKQISEINKGYQECSQEVVASVKASKLKPGEVNSALANCRDRYPAAALYTDCTRALMKGAKPNEVNAQKVADCRKFLTSASFNEKESIPFVVNNDRLFFAGVGLNQTSQAIHIKPEGFACEKISQVFENAKLSQYLLFGNHYQTFAASDPKAAQHYQGIETAIKLGKKILKKNDPYLDITGFGRLFFDQKNPKSEPVVYFPSANCDFTAKLGPLFAGISTYYLIDQAQKEATPYFGIAYYAKNAKTLNTMEAVSELQRKLGPEYRAYTKDKLTVIVASAPFGEVDSERDPRNICKPERLHSYVGIIRAQTDQPDMPEYLIVANVKNLCDYGDRLIRRFGR